MELLVVMAIIAILALLAAPNFQDTIVRNEIKEALPLADIAKQPVALMWSMTRTFPSTNDDVLLPSPEKIVSNLVKSVAVRDGAINVTFGNRANGAINGKVMRRKMNRNVPPDMVAASSNSAEICAKAPRSSWMPMGIALITNATISGMMVPYSLFIPGTPSIRLSNVTPNPNARRSNMVPFSLGVIFRPLPLRR